MDRSMECKIEVIARRLRRIEIAVTDAQIFTTNIINIAMFMSIAYLSLPGEGSWRKIAILVVGFVSAIKISVDLKKAQRELDKLNIEENQAFSDEGKLR